MSTKTSDSVADVIIVGGGLSGLLVADRLGRRGLDCLLLEAGPTLKNKRPPIAVRQFDAATKPLLEIDQDAWRFRSTGPPYDWMRVRALGGRSLLWGGWCERIDAQNLRDAQGLEATWPVSLIELALYYRAVERRLGIRTARVSPFFKQVTSKLGLEVTGKRGSVLSQGTRALCGLDLPQPRVRGHSVALRLISVNGRIRQIELIDTRTGKVQVLSANAFVLCASPIETTRLLLESGIQGESGLVGAGLVDHLVATCLAILPYPAPTLGPPKPLERCALIPRFVNVGRQHRRDYRSGFTVEILGPNSLSELGQTGIHGLGIDDKETKQLSFCLVHAIGEGHAHAKRFVALDSDDRDSLGRPIPVINLAWSEEQKLMAADMDETVAAVADALAPPNSRIIRLRDALQPGGIAHEAGTARMGKRSRDSVVDSTGAVFGVRGLYIADASIQPTALDRHPTLTLLALALRTADRILHDRSNGV